MSGANVGLQTALPIIGGILQGHLYRFQGDMQARSTLLAGDAQAFNHRRNAQAALDEAKNIRDFTSQQVYSLDMNTNAHLADMQYEYAKAGIPFSGSAAANIKSNIDQVGLQRQLVISAGSKDEYNMQLAAAQSMFMANMASIEAKLTAKVQKHTGRLMGNQAIAGGILTGIANGARAASYQKG